jgi:hypothetical protein
MSTPSRSWHLDPSLAEAYVDGTLDPVRAASVEQHLLGCGDCRDLLAPSVDAARLEIVWTDVLDRVQAPPRSVVERTLSRLGLDGNAARLAAATPILRGAWLTGVIGVLLLAMFAAQLTPHGAVLFIALAPVLPAVGVALAFGRATDPLHEITLATPYPALGLLAVRTLLVVATTTVPTLVAALLLPGTTWFAVAWLLPSLAVSTGTLALSTRTTPETAAGLLSVVWLAVVVPAAFDRSATALLLSPWLQVVGLLGLLAGLAALSAHRDDLSEMLRRSPR